MKRDDREKWVNQQNNLVEGKQNLKLNSAKLIRVAIMNIGMKDTELKPCTISVQQLSELFDISPTNLYRSMPQICKELAQSVVEVKKVNGNKVYWKATPWISEIEYDSAKGVKILLNYKLKDQLLNLRENYTRYYLEEILTMKSVYAIRIFELLMDRKRKKVIPQEGIDIEISVATIKEACGCKSKAYDSFHNVRNRVIETAINEINEKTNYKISDCKYIKENKSVVALVFHMESSPLKLKQREVAV